jgi:hypothetical protein
MPGSERGVETDSAPVLLRKLRHGHPAIQDLGPRSEDVVKVLNASGALLDAMLPLRTGRHPHTRMRSCSARRRHISSSTSRGRSTPIWMRSLGREPAPGAGSGLVPKPFPLGERHGGALVLSVPGQAGPTG